MKIETYKQFRKLNKRLSKVERDLGVMLVLLAALVDEGSDKAAAKALAADVIKNTAALKLAASAIPATAGTTAA